MEAIDSNAWKLESSAVVCRQLDCGSVVSTVISSLTSDVSMWSSFSHCVGSESSLRECVRIVEWEYYSHDILKVICSGN